MLDPAVMHFAYCSVLPNTSYKRPAGMQAIRMAQASRRDKDVFHSPNSFTRTSIHIWLYATIKACVPPIFPRPSFPARPTPSLGSYTLHVLPSIEWGIAE